MPQPSSTARQLRHAGQSFRSKYHTRHSGGAWFAAAQFRSGKLCLVSVRAPCSAACRSSQQRSSNARTVRREAQLRNDAHFCDSVTHLGSKHGVMLIQTCAALTCVRGDAGATHTTMRRTAIDSDRGRAACRMCVQAHVGEHSHNSRCRQPRRAASHEMAHIFHRRHRVRAQRSAQCVVQGRGSRLKAGRALTKRGQRKSVTAALQRAATHTCRYLRQRPAASGTRWSARALHARLRRTEEAEAPRRCAATAAP